MRLRGIRRPFESLLLGLGAVTVPLLPRRAVVSLARGLGGVAYLVSGRLRRVALANLAAAFGDSMPPARCREVARESFRASALVVLDLLWFGRSPARRIPAHVRWDPSAELYFENAPAVAVSAHFGNWEILGQALALRGAPAMAVVAPISNPLADRMLTRLRRLTGQEVTPREGAFKTLVRTLRDGGYVGLMMDQNTVPARGGEFVKFFGLPVPMSRAAAALEEKTAATVVFIFCLPDGRGNYTVRALRPGPAGHGRTTQALAEAMEDVIRRDPGQWMWTYKRWKYIPPGASRDGFPFYARGMKEEEQRRPGTALAAMGNGAC